jgi:hypothetical protein
MPYVPDSAQDAQQEISINLIESFREHVGDTVARREAIRSE